MKKIFILVVLILAAISITGFIFYRAKQAATQNKPAPTGQNQNASSTAAANASTTENGTTTVGINNFEECVAAGKEVIGEKPRRQCIVSYDLVYIEIETCTAPGGETMNAFEAQRIFETDHCSWEGSATEKQICDEVNGKWLIGIQAYRKDCNPVCEIDIAAKKSKVNWNCANTINE
jgi:hypothetical protein